ncbi:hypothetical protein Moror_16638 [Moniliophthora roreri MCA 2997]|uniref:Uncharacterized protein n=2 Tax=Moniliophthora roreri TaxID=221103 RepID=V2WHD7_MONRO|nr:hypothetical protein Moror_16638 [Moniliophthora roreri MCA 2997]
MRFIVPSSTTLSGSLTQHKVRQARGLDDDADASMASPTKQKRRPLQSHMTLADIPDVDLEDAAMASPTKQKRRPLQPHMTLAGIPDVDLEDAAMASPTKSTSQSEQPITPCDPPLRDLKPFSVTTFCQWYETLTLEKRRALMVSMMEVCKERAKRTRGRKGKPVRLQKESAEGAKEIQVQPRNPDDLAFQWRLEADDNALVVQFTKWYTALNHEEQGGALAYSAMKDGETVDDLPSEAEVGARKTRSQTQSQAGHRKLTREASKEIHTWAQSYVKQRKNRVVVPNIPSTGSTSTVQRESSVVFVSTTEDASSPEALPDAPGHGLRPKLTRSGTLVLDKYGDPTFEKIPEEGSEKGEGED